MKEATSPVSGKNRAWIALSGAIALVLLVLILLLTCTNTGRLFRKVGIPCRVEWSCEPEGYGHTLYVCQTKQSMAACALKNASQTDGAAVASVDCGEELQLMRSYADNGTPKTEFLYLFLVMDGHFKETGVKNYDYKGLTHYTIQPVGDALVILCITETDIYSSDELRQIGINAYNE